LAIEILKIIIFYFKIKTPLKIDSDRVKMFLKGVLCGCPAVNYSKFTAGFPTSLLAVAGRCGIPLKPKPVQNVSWEAFKL